MLVDVVVDVDDDGKPVPSAHDVAQSLTLWSALANFHHVSYGI